MYRTRHTGDDEEFFLRDEFMPKEGEGKVVQIATQPVFISRLGMVHCPLISVAGSEPSLIQTQIICQRFASKGVSGFT